MSHITGAPGQTFINPLYQQPAPVQNQPQGAPRDVKSNDRMLSGAELVTRMGAEPKANLTVFGKTVHTNSAEYKSALAHLETYNEHADNMGTIGSFTDTKVQTLKQDLRAVIADADAYIAKHGGDTDKTGRRDVMGEVKRMAEAELANLDGMSSLKGPALNGLSVADGMALLRGGVKSDDRVNLTLNDAAIDAGRSKDKFGSGKVNTVSLIAYGNDMRVVKPLAGRIADGQAQAGAEKSIGIDRNNTNYAARNIASANVAAALGCANTIPQVDVVLHHGEPALAMPLAKGESLIYKHNDPVTDAAILTRLNNNETVNNHKSDGQGGWLEERTDFKAVPYNDASKPGASAEVKKGLLDLQTIDCLIGQFDRQPENIHVQVTGHGANAQIIGIDNDMCMGPHHVGLTTLFHPVLNDEIPVRSDINCVNYAGPPPVMSRAVADIITNMSVDTFKGLLGHDLSDAEIGSAVTRLNEMKAHVTTLEGAERIVSDFANGTVKDNSGSKVSVHDFLMQNTTDNTYYRRDLTTQSTGPNGQPRTNLAALDASKH